MKLSELFIDKDISDGKFLQAKRSQKLRQLQM